MSVSTFSLSVSIIILFSSFSTIDAKRGSGFLYICTGAGCDSNDMALTFFSIFGSIGLCCLCACLKGCLCGNEDETRLV